MSRSRALPRRSSKWWVLLGAVTVLGTPYLAEAHSADKPTWRRKLLSPPDTVPEQRFRVLPAHLRSRELLPTEYLRRALHQPAKHPEASTASTPAKQYSQRYRIPLELAQQILDVSLAEGIDPELGFRLIRTESRFQIRARGPGGSLGLTQLMPATARSVDPALRTEAEVLDPSNNLRVGFRYLRTMIEQFGGDVRLGLLAYNRGENTVKRALKQGADPENGYSRKVLGPPGGNRYQGKGLVYR